MLQDDLQTKYTGGTVLHLFLGEQVSDIETVKSLIRKVSDNYHLPYFTLTPTFSVCPSHGYLNGEQTRCSHCNRETEVYSRVVGYLRPVKQWNDGKQAEYCRRQNLQGHPRGARCDGGSGHATRKRCPLQCPADGRPHPKRWIRSAPMMPCGRWGRSNKP
jgi:hypothetical protein